MKSTKFPHVWLLTYDKEYQVNKFFLYKRHKKGIYKHFTVESLSRPGKNNFKNKTEDGRGPLWHPQCFVFSKPLFAQACEVNEKVIQSLKRNICSCQLINDDSWECYPLVLYIVTGFNVVYESKRKCSKRKEAFNFVFLHFRLPALTCFG